MKKSKKLQVSYALESQAYNNDEEFKDEDKKLDYYSGDLFLDCDYIYKKGQVFDVAQIDNELLFQFDEDLGELTDKDIEAIKCFYDNKCFKQKKEIDEFKELSTWPIDIKKSEKQIDNCKLGIKYRGGSGYYYAWWILKK